MIKHIFRYKVNDMVILGIIGALLCALIFLLINVFNITLTSSKIAHQKKQLEMARAAALGINSSFEFIYKDIKSAAGFSNEQISNMEDFEIIKYIARINSKGELLNDNGLKVYSDSIQLDNLSNQLKSANEVAIVSDVFEIEKSAEESELIFYILTKSQSNNSDNTYVLAVLSFEWFINSFIKPLHLSENDFAWIMGSDGRLIYHPSHEDMVFRNINDSESKCLECHTDFNFQKSMILQQEGTGEYFIIGEPQKIMAFKQISFFNKHWTLAISTYESFVEKHVYKSLMSIFLLTGIIILIILIMGYLTFQINLKRIKAEEVKKQLAQSKAFQEKLNHASKLASIGELVDSVAHEINTPTSVIKTVSDTMSYQECLKSDCSDNLKTIIRQTERISNYTKSLLKFSRRMPYLPEKGNIRELIEECVFLVAPRLKSKRAVLERIVPDDYPLFTFDKGRIEQVLINLLNNAIDFVPEKGIIEIELTTVIRDENNFAQISVKDNGSGIKKENLGSIFEPFFSTKPLSSGTGLGLSISKAIIERHEGKMEVESTPGEFTIFRVLLPIKQES